MSNQLKTIGDYWSDRSEEFSKYMKEHLDEELSKDYYKLIREAVNGRHLRALDIGCGPGIASMMLAEMGCEVFAIDWSEGMVKQVTENSKERGLKIDIRRMDAQDLDFDDRFFDLVVSSRLVWNLPDPIKAYSEWLRVLKNDGTMVLYDGNYFLKTDGRKAQAPFEDDTEGPQMYQGADFRIIRNVAKELPLSKEVRPAWDVSALTSLGVFTINIHMENYAPTDDGGRKVPSTFVLVVEKERKGDLIE